MGWGCGIGRRTRTVRDDTTTAISICGSILFTYMSKAKTIWNYEYQWLWKSWGHRSRHLHIVDVCMSQYYEYFSSVYTLLHHNIFTFLCVFFQVPSRHTFLIRHPHRFLLSQRKMFLRMTNYQGDPSDFNMFNATPMLKESFYTTDSMHWLWKHVQETGKDPNPIIIDAEDVLNHADKILPKYLDALGIPFHEKYLTWDASEESLKTWKGCTEQVVIGKRMGIFDKAFKSSCFMPNIHPEPTKEDLTRDLVTFGELLMPGYQEMYKKRIKPE